MPASLKTAISVGIGLFIALIGFVDAGFVTRIPDAAGTTVPVQLGGSGELSGWPVVVFCFGALLVIALWVRRVKGAILISIVATTVLAVIVDDGREPAQQPRPVPRSDGPPGREGLPGPLDGLVALLAIGRFDGRDRLLRRRVQHRTHRRPVTSSGVWTACRCRCDGSAQWEEGQAGAGTRIVTSARSRGDAPSR